jgi:hypothetical protein
MFRFEKALLVLAAIVVIPAIAHAQASIVGTVRDSSGAVIPGVTASRWKRRAPCSLRT